jgi:hypothetical protein
MLAMPFEKFERRKFVQRQKELTQLKFNSVLWRQLSPTDRATLAQMAHTALDLYYDSDYRCPVMSGMTLPDHDLSRLPRHNSR